MAFKYIYGTTRDRHYKNGVSLNDISLNGGYTTEFFNRGQFRDYEEAGIVKLSMPIPNERYVGILPKIDENEQIIGTVPKLTRFVMLKYSDLYTNPTDLQASIEKSSSDTAVQIFPTAIDAVQWLWDNTNLENVPEMESEGVYVFLLSPETTDPMGVTTPAQYLTIDTNA